MVAATARRDAKGSLSVSPSPDFTPRDQQSDSQTSLSSADEKEQGEASAVEPLDLQSLDAKLTSVGSKAQAGKAAVPDSQGLMDSYGNEFQLPDISIQAVRSAIPAHCYNRSIPRSLFYVFRDLAQASLNWYLFAHVVTPRVPFATYPILNTGLWALYTVIQGFILTGVWVLAHECGHGAFSASRTLNDTVGFILHSALGVPYHAWKITHGKHHKATAHMERDQVFMPLTRDQFSRRVGRLAHELAELGEEAPLVSASVLLGQQLAGWWLYLATNVTGHNKHEKAAGERGKGKQNGWGGGVNHFNPDSPVFDEKDRHLILMSDAGLLALLAVLTGVYIKYGAFNLVVGYIIPYLWVNNWLVWITYLQHTDPTLPHYTPAAWTFARGAAATIDREFGFIGRYFMHGIVETHVLHHFVSTIPFYHADEATEAIKPVLGVHYRSDTTLGIYGFVRALWRSARLCNWVEPCAGAKGEQEQGVLFFRSRNQQAKRVDAHRPLVLKKDGMERERNGYDSGILIPPSQ